MSESKSDALPLGYGPAMPAGKAGRRPGRARKNRRTGFKDPPQKGKDRAAPGCAVFGGVPRGIRTLGLQSHNLAR